MIASANLPAFTTSAVTPCRQKRGRSRILQWDAAHDGEAIWVSFGRFKTIIVARRLLLAKYPNVSVKLSAAPNYSTESYPFRDFLPHIWRLFDAYGPQRCYWGTDITNGFDRARYRQRITHFTEELPFLSEEDKDWIMGRAIVARLDWS